MSLKWKYQLPRLASCARDAGATYQVSNMSENRKIRRKTEEELSDEYHVEVRLTAAIDMSKPHNVRRVKALISKAADKIPDDETVREMQLTADIWTVPKVSIWCNSQGFDYSNSQVHDIRFMSDGQLFDGQVDVRPF